MTDTQQSTKAPMGLTDTGEMLLGLWNLPDADGPVSPAPAGAADHASGVVALPCYWCESVQACDCLDRRLAAVAAPDPQPEVEPPAPAPAADAQATTGTDLVPVDAEPTAPVSAEDEPKPGRAERIRSLWDDRHERRIAALRRQATTAGARRDYQTNAAVVALVAERRWRLVYRVLWAAVIGGLSFTMTNVQQFIVDAEDIEKFSPMWWAAWLVDPMVSLVFVAVIMAEEITNRFKIAIKGRWVWAAKWGAFGSTYAMNTWAAWSDAIIARFGDGTIAPIIVHSIPPGVVLVAIEVIPVVRRAMTEAIEYAAALADPTGLATGKHRPEPTGKRPKTRRGSRPKTTTRPTENRPENTRATDRKTTTGIPRPTGNPPHRSTGNLAEVEADAATERPENQVTGFQVDRKQGRPGRRKSVSDQDLHDAKVRLTKELGREPTGQEIGDEVGLSKNTVNDRLKSKEKKA